MCMAVNWAGPDDRLRQIDIVSQGFAVVRWRKLLDLAPVDDEIDTHQSIAYLRQLQARDSNLRQP